MKHCKVLPKQTSKNYRSTKMPKTQIGNWKYKKKPIQNINEY